MPSEGDAAELDRYRGYLHLLASADLEPALQGKIDVSGVVQVTLLEAHQGRGQFRGTGHDALASWLRQILARNLLDEIRRLKGAKHNVARERSLDESSEHLEAWLAAEHSSPSERANRNEQLLRLADALQQLPADQRTAVLRHHLQGATLADVAEEMQRSKEAVAGLLHRGLTKLRDLLCDRTTDGGPARTD
jgi:RNA polymerase sigma-70 factor (ECF subfamily)